MKYALLAVCTLLLSACATTRGNYKANGQDRVSVMTFNVENFFDLEDDPAKNDEAFLPAAMKNSAYYENKCRAQNEKYKGGKSVEEDPGSDEAGMRTFRIDECLGRNYDAKIQARKMSRMADVVKQVGNGRGPDILFLEEVENIDVLKKWRDGYLQGLGYKTMVLIEGPDERGIDTALLSRLDQLGEARIHTIDFRAKEPAIAENDLRPTRGILETRLKLPNGEPVAVFTVHFPSQGASTLHRSAAIKTLLDAVAAVPAGTHVLAGGDFNITSTEDWKMKYYRGLIGDKLAVSHLEGCQGCPGSTYYNRDQTWSFFDVLLFEKSMLDPKSTWQLDRSSIQLVKSSVYQVDHDGTPAKFRKGLGSIGVSDHFPMYAEIFTPAPVKIGAQQ